jgi:PKD repeat protein
MRRNVHWKKFSFSAFIFAILFTLAWAPAAADVIIDNGNPGTSFVGTWYVSGGTLPYGPDSLWARNGATYTWQMGSQPHGTYEVFMWWSGFSSRSDSVPVSIEHGGLTTSLTIDQSQNAGKWNSLGQYNFDGSGRVTITAAYGSTVSTCADAVWFKQVTDVPADEIIIDNRATATSQSGTWSVSGASGYYGVDSVWSRDGTTFTWWFTPPESGLYEVSMWWTEWSSRSSSVPVRIEHAGGTATVTINQQQNGARWNSLASYSFQAGTPYAVTITSQPYPTSTCADAVKFNFIESGQENLPPTAVIDSISPNPALVGYHVMFEGYGEDLDGDVVAYQWTSSIDGPIGSTSSFSTSSLSAGTHTIRLVVTDNEGALSDEAVSYLVVESASDGLIIDNGDSRTSSTGTWAVSGGTLPYGSDSLWARDGATYTWYMDSQPSGTYEVFMWWSGYSSRSASVPVTIEHGGLTTSLNIDQSQDAGKWNSLGRYTFNGSGRVTITAAYGSGVSTCADAVRFSYIGPAEENLPPTAVIDSISPNPASVGQTVTFQGDGTDQDGSIAAYRWTSNIDGQIGSSSSFSTSSLSAGNHTISLVVTDDKGALSDEASASLLIESTANEGLIIDNRDSRTSSTGTWAVSGASGYYGVDSVWSRDGATFTWSFTPPESGLYEVSMWWTEWPSRSSSVPVRIQYAGGSASLSINQQQNGATWNFLGAYSFQAGNSYAIMITSQPYPTSTCADAVQFRFLGSGQENIAPVALDDSAITTEGDPVNINVTDNDYDPDGTLDLSSLTITGSAGHGTAVFQGNGIITYTPSAGYTGTDAFKYRVRDNEGSLSNEAAVSVLVQTADANVEHIFVCLGYATSTNQTKSNTIAMLQDMGAHLQDGLWIYERQDKTFIIHIVENLAGMKAALKTTDAHVLFHGHSNYGLGAVFATPQEIRNQTIYDILYLDDDRILNTSSTWIGVSVSGMRNSQAYPNWWPVFKDGTSAITPYQLDDPYGDPPYNYYITYQLPGDPTYYKLETAKNAALERFAGSGRLAWYDAAGAVPDPNNPGHWEYYLTPPYSWYSGAEWSPSFEFLGDWAAANTAPGYFRENYYYAAAGTGTNQAIWTVQIPTAGRYKVSAWWPAAGENALNVPYTISHAEGSTTVQVDQRVNGGRWNALGTFNFNAGEYTITLTNHVASGQVVADAVRVEHVENPSEILKADFNARNRSGLEPLEVVFDSEDVGEITSRLWDFGDGQTDNRQGVISHTYLAPGTYTVTYTVSGPLGADTITKSDYIHVGSATPVFQAEFSAATVQEGAAPLEVAFENHSSGDIVGWEWRFGDGATSSAQNPTHTYILPGVYDVSLTVTNNDGSRVTETKRSFIRAVIFDESIDNVVYPAKHYGNRTILFRDENDIAPEEMRYKRLLYVSCSSGLYYADIFQRGIMFYTLATSSRGYLSLPAYLEAYLLGKSDNEIWRTIQNIEPLYDYYNFDKRPSEQ